MNINNILINLDNISIDILFQAIIVFLLTLLIKYPLKKITSKYEETKRKALNIAIIIIPMFLSFLISILYSGIFYKIWFSNKIFKSSLSILVLSISIYEIISRILIVLKSIKSGKNTLESPEIKEEIQSIETEITNIIKKIDVDKEKMNKVNEKIIQLNELKNILLNKNNSISLISNEDIEKELLKLEIEKNNIKEINKE